MLSKASLSGFCNISYALLPRKPHELIDTHAFTHTNTHIHKYIHTYKNDTLQPTQYALSYVDDVGQMMMMIVIIIIDGFMCLVVVALVQLSYPPYFLPVLTSSCFLTMMVNAGLKAFRLGPELLTI